MFIDVSSSVEEVVLVQVLSSLLRDLRDALPFGPPHVDVALHHQVLEAERDLLGVSPEIAREVVEERRSITRARARSTSPGV